MREMHLVLLARSYCAPAQATQHEDQVTRLYEVIRVGPLPVD
jgi:hypothetical protein